MRKLLVCAVLIALLAVGQSLDDAKSNSVKREQPGAESIRMPRQAEEEGEVPAPAEEVDIPAAEEEVVTAPVEEEAAPAPAEEEAAAPHAEEAAPHAEELSASSPAEEKGTASRVMDTLRSYYDQTLNTASGYLEDIKGLKLEEKARNLYVETSTAVKTYAGVMQDQLYHMIGSQ